MKKIILLTCAICSATALAKPVVNVSPNTKGGISKTVTETWSLTDDEKKNYAPQTMMMSQISATAIAPTSTIKRKSWTAVNSQHRMCFYNTFGSTVEGRYQIKMNVAGKEVNAFDKVPVGGGQGYCVTRYLELWLYGASAGQSPSVANTHVEMDGNSTDNEGRGTITVK